MSHDEQSKIDIIRKEAYPIDAPEGVEYERDRVREFSKAVGNLRAGKTDTPQGVAACRDEAFSVFAAVMAWHGMRLPVNP